jgi:hypothetical protein
MRCLRLRLVVCLLLASGLTVSCNKEGPGRMKGIPKDFKSEVKDDVSPKSPVASKRQIHREPTSPPAPP